MQKEPQNRIDMLEVFTSNHPQTFSIPDIKTRLSLGYVVDHHVKELVKRKLIEHVGTIPGENNIPTRIFRATQKALTPDESTEPVVADCESLLFKAWPNAVCN